MTDFKKRNRFGGDKGDRRGGNFGKKNFGNSHFGGDRGRSELFQAICASCGKSCEVPFRPNGKKPVYCKECFDRNNGGAPSSYRQENRPERQESRPVQQADNGIYELKRQLETLHTKLDTLITIMSGKTTTEVSEEKKPAKKAAKRK